MAFEEDVKIFDSKEIRQQEAGETPPADTSLTSRDQLDAARVIGSALAEMTKQAERGFELAIDDDLLLQRRLLLCFAVSTGLEDNAVTPQVARTTLNTFYDTLKRTDPGFYDDIGNSGGLSFYYLAKRQHGDIERRIGQTFAMLCGKDGDPVCQELGEALYFRYLNMVQVALQSKDLAK
ncbi:MAG: hypothetical protein J6X61_01295 [Clostridia bacterium]|nr:hypothetical protein [Clostridia bacterium]